MDMSKFYLNATTGEITNNHKTAVGWYSDGNNVEIHRNGKCVATWEV